MKTLEKIATSQALGTQRTRASAHVHWVPILALLGCLLFLVFSRDAHAAVPAPKAAAAPAPAAAPAAAIYKLVDASGRVTYSNTPVKGATQVELDPITVIPGTPSGSLGDAAKEKAALALPPAPILIPVEAPAIAPIAPVPAVKLASPAPASITPTTTPVPTPASTRAVAQVTATAPAKAAPVQAVKVSNTPTASAAATSPNPLGLPVVKLRPDGATPDVVVENRAPQFAAVLDQAPVAAPAIAPTAEAIALTKREDARQKMVMSNIADEERILAAVKEQLVTERRQSDSMRALRAGLVTSPDPNKTAANAEVRAQVERHFERVRDLQDQVAMHERNIAEMRQKLRGDALATR